MAITEKEWITLAEARGLDPGTGKKLEPEYDPHCSPSGDLPWDSPWTDRDIKELHRDIRGLRDQFTVITRLSMAGVGAIVLLHFIH